MRYTAASSVLALLLGVGAWGQDTKKTSGPVPPTLNQPGQQHPMPIPREHPVVPPDVRTPQHETGRERPVTASDQSGATPSAAGRTTPKQAGRARAAEVSEGKHEGSDKSKQDSSSKASKTRAKSGKR